MIMLPVGTHNRAPSKNPPGPFYNCPICRSRSLVICQIDGARYLSCLCPNCDLRFSHPMVAGTRDYYEGSDTYEREVAASAGNPSERFAIEAGRWSFSSALRVVRAHGGPVLDIGCGTGEFLALVQKKLRCECTGIDINERELSVACNAYGLKNLFCGTLEEFIADASPKSFSVVTLLDVLEHLADPLLALTKASSLLATGGTLCVSVPSHRRWPRIFDPVLDNPPHHLTLWSERALRHALEAAGLGVVEVDRAPLLVRPLLGHLRMRGERCWRQLGRRLEAGGQSSKLSAPPCAPPTGKEFSSGRMKRNVIRLAEIGALPLRLIPGVGGFTLFGVARRRSP
jgi:SAM-dependent methyltransferase